MKVLAVSAPDRQVTLEKTFRDICNNSFFAWNQGASRRRAAPDLPPQTNRVRARLCRQSAEHRWGTLNHKPHRTKVAAPTRGRGRPCGVNSHLASLAFAFADNIKRTPYRTVSSRNSNPSANIVNPTPPSTQMTGTAPPSANCHKITQVGTR